MWREIFFFIVEFEDEIWYLNKASFCSINVVLTCWCCRGDPFLTNSSNCVYRSRNFSRRLVLCQRRNLDTILLWFGDSEIHSCYSNPFCAAGPQRLRKPQNWSGWLVLKRRSWQKASVEFLRKRLGSCCSCLSRSGLLNSFFCPFYSARAEH
jgi:hypothetical protein